jgi:hypothetical protein
MRRSFIIITFVLAINFTSPNIQVIAQTVRHQIEYAQEDKSKDITDSELLKNKVVMYMRLQVLTISVAVIDNCYGFNTS